MKTRTPTSSQITLVWQITLADLRLDFWRRGMHEWLPQGLFTTTNVNARLRIIRLIAQSCEATEDEVLALVNAPVLAGPIKSESGALALGPVTWLAQALDKLTLAPFQLVCTQLDRSDQPEFGSPLLGPDAFARLRACMGLRHIVLCRVAHVLTSMIQREVAQAGGSNGVFIELQARSLALHTFVLKARESSRGLLYLLYCESVRQAWKGLELDPNVSGPELVAKMRSRNPVAGQRRGNTTVWRTAVEVTEFLESQYEARIEELHSMRLPDEEARHFKVEAKTDGRRWLKLIKGGMPRLAMTGTMLSAGAAHFTSTVVEAPKLPSVTQTSKTPAAQENKLIMPAPSASAKYLNLLTNEDRSFLGAKNDNEIVAALTTTEIPAGATRVSKMLTGTPATGAQRVYFFLRPGNAWAGVTQVMADAAQTPAIVLNAVTSPLKTVADQLPAANPESAKGKAAAKPTRKNKSQTTTKATAETARWLDKLTIADLDNLGVTDKSVVQIAERSQDLPAEGATVMRKSISDQGTARDLWFYVESN